MTESWPCGTGMKYSTSKQAVLVYQGFVELWGRGKAEPLEQTTGIKESENQAGILERKGMVEESRAGQVM